MAIIKTIININEAEVQKYDTIMNNRSYLRIVRKGYRFESTFYIFLYDNPSIEDIISVLDNEFNKRTVGFTIVYVEFVIRKTSKKGKIKTISYIHYTNNLDECKKKLYSTLME